MSISIQKTEQELRAELRALKALLPKQKKDPIDKPLFIMLEPSEEQAIRWDINKRLNIYREDIRESYHSINAAEPHIIPAHLVPLSDLQLHQVLRNKKKKKTMRSIRTKKR